jgi:hypothetical protein
MTLLSGISVRFSKLRHNHEPTPYWVWNRQDVRTYTRFGVLPTGESFGVAHTPTQENSYARDTAIITEDGEIRACGWAFPDGGIGNHYPEPEVMIASPSARTIVWLGGGELWVWYQDDELQRFISGFTKRVSIPDGAAVLDARMNENDTLDLWCEGGARHVYSCDGDVLVRDHHAADLLRSADGETIIPVTHEAEEHPEGVLGYMESCFSAFPQAAGFLIEGDVDLGNWDLCGLHARELRFAPEVERIGAGAFAMLIGLERVVIPATVHMVEDCAFQYCDTLTDLVIEGDLSRVASWHEDAFDECPCEEYYLDLRSKAAAGEL